MKKIITMGLFLIVPFFIMSQITTIKVTPTINKNILLGPLNLETTTYDTNRYQIEVPLGIDTWEITPYFTGWNSVTDTVYWDILTTPNRYIYSRFNGTVRKTVHMNDSIPAPFEDVIGPTGRFLVFQIISDDTDTAWFRAILRLNKK